MLTQGALASVLAHTEGRVDPNGIDVSAALASLQPKDSASPRAPDDGIRAGRGIPYFGQVSSDYIEMRRKAGAAQSELDTLRLRRKTFLDVLGDRPVTDYFPSDLQSYVSEMRFWPANVTKRFDRTARMTKQRWSTTSMMRRKPTVSAKR